MLNRQGLVSADTMKTAFRCIVNKRYFGKVPSTALSIDKVFKPAAKVKDLRATLVLSYGSFNISKVLV